MMMAAYPYLVPRLRMQGNLPPYFMAMVLSKGILSLYLGTFTTMQIKDTSSVHMQETIQDDSDVI